MNVKDNHILDPNSVNGKRAIRDWICKAYQIYGQQELIHYMHIQVGGEKIGSTWNSYYINKESKYLVIDFRTARKQYDSEWCKDYDCDFQIVNPEDIDKDEIDDMNADFQLDNLDKWFRADVNEITAKNRLDYQICPFKINEDRRGMYVVTSGVKFKHIVLAIDEKSLFDMCDKFDSIPSNFTLHEMVDMGYLKVEDHMSWLGQQGSHVHAVLAYFRKKPDKSVYYRLDTWCGGNHPLAHEHSPTPEYPTAEKVSCKKCLKKIQKKLIAK